MKQKDFIDALDQKAISDAIAAAEKRCSGEVRVHIQPRSGSADLRTVAEKTFERLGMTQTKLRNGVLLFIASEEQRFTILGDQGINDKVGEGFWSQIAENLTAAFKEGSYSGGIVAAIKACGDALAEHFPYQSNDADELSNDISIQHDQE
jgi:uncharacterized membrane protein